MLVLLGGKSIAYAEDEFNKNSLSFSAEPAVWHINGFRSQNLLLKMYFWSDLEGEDLTGKGLNGTISRREFIYRPRSFNNKLAVGDHVLKPMSLKFQGQKYVSNSLAVKVLPEIDGFRGVRAYFAEGECKKDEIVQLVIYEYRDKKDEIHDFKFAEQEDYELWNHGGNTSSFKDTDGKEVWVRMRYCSVKFKQDGLVDITSKHLVKTIKGLGFSVTMRVDK